MVSSAEGASSSAGYQVATPKQGASILGHTFNCSAAAKPSEALRTGLGSTKPSFKCLRSALHGMRQRSGELTLRVSFSDLPLAEALQLRSTRCPASFKLLCRANLVSAERVPFALSHGMSYIGGKLQVFTLPRKLMSNPSLKLSPNGGPRGPGRRYAVHFRQPGPRVPPSVPA